MNIQVSLTDYPASVALIADTTYQQEPLAEETMACVPFQEWVYVYITCVHWSSLFANPAQINCPTVDLPVNIYFGDDENLLWLMFDECAAHGILGNIRWEGVQGWSGCWRLHSLCQQRGFEETQTPPGTADHQEVGSDCHFDLVSTHRDY